MTKNEITQANPENALSGFYSSLRASDQKERLELFDLVSAAEGLDDHLNTPLSLTDVVIQAVPVMDQETGEVEERSRIVLITEDGKSYATTSRGVETALKNLFLLVGEPTWEPPLELMAVKQQGRNGYKFTTLVRAQ